MKRSSWVVCKTTQLSTKTPVESKDHNCNVSSSDWNLSLVELYRGHSGTKCASFDNHIIRAKVAWSMISRDRKNWTPSNSRWQVYDVRCSKQQWSCVVVMSWVASNTIHNRVWENPWGGGNLVMQWRLPKQVWCRISPLANAFIGEEWILTNFGGRTTAWTLLHCPGRTGG